MTIEQSSSAYGRIAPPLDAFRSAAQQHDAVQLTLDGEQWQVQGTGVLPGSGRKVAWVSPGSDQVDTTSAFVHALGQSFSAGISRAVARELDLHPDPGQPLSSRTVTHAIEMAQHGQQALSGVDFFTRLQFSAASGGPEFKRIATEAGLSSGLQKDALARVDQFLDQKFAEAQSNGASPITYRDAERWLKEALNLSR
ncbi:hypothetical protein [Ottowia thiooxydans]|uniref:hypothetical protein n=1 Tax=Ottowia thiooxydans TaxID=219182 RepID=UPI00056997DC|nr:hypothetical protein [Ottowia thiooxydans]